MSRVVRAIVGALLLLGPGGCGVGRPPAGREHPGFTVSPQERVALPNSDGSLKFVVLGDFGTGGTVQYQVAARMERIREHFPFRLVLTVGDNLYGSELPQDFKQKFEIPYGKLLSDGVRFRAALGNHDDRNQRFYKSFNMDGELYYSFAPSGESVRFFVLDTTYPDPEQFAWLERELEQAEEDWRIVYFHHPLYSSGGRHGSDLALRRALEPLLIRHNVSVVFAGHDHFYERTRPQNGIVHFVVGSGGKLAPGDIRARTGLTERGFDQDNVILVAELEGDRLAFNAITRSGEIVDSGVIVRRGAAGIR